jgi:hypothetical protein
MNYFLIGFLISIKTSIKSKRKFIEDDLKTDYSTDEQKNHDSLKDESSYLNFNNLHSCPNIVQLLQQNKKFRKEENNDGGFIDLSNFLDLVEFQEPSKEYLDKCSPVDMNIKDLDKLLDLETKSEKTIGATEIRKNIQPKSLQRPADSTNSINNEPIFTMNLAENVIKYNGSSYCETKNFTNPCLLKTDAINSSQLREHRKKLKFYILGYIKNNIKSIYRTSYTSILNDIDKACNSLEKHQLNETKYNFIFSPSYDRNLFEILKTFYSKFDKTSNFDQKTCDKFMIDFESNVLESSETLLTTYGLNALIKTEKQIFFYSEISKLYKYIADLPELLTLCRLYSISSFTKIIIVLHSINLFASKTGHLKENNVFVLSMIYVAFQNFYGKNSFDLFMFLDYELICHKNKQRHNMYYFLWELSLNRRQNIKLRNVSIFVNESMDAIYLRVNFLIFLYQHSLFIRCINVKGAYFNSFDTFVEKVKQNEMCFGCLFNEYLHRTQIFNKENF